MHHVDLKRISRDILTVFFPVTCAGCGNNLPASDYLRVCNSCREQVRIIDGHFCRLCGVPLPDGGAHCYHCKKKSRRYFDAIRSAGPYEGVLRDFIHKFKYQHKDYLDRFLAKIMHDAFMQRTELHSVDVLVPVPLHWSKRLIRGYNQSALLARHLSTATGRPWSGDVLCRTRMTRAQYRLTREERVVNLMKSITVRNAHHAFVYRKNVLVIDDVCTTTATINACARALCKAGAAAVYGLTLARD